MLQLDRVHIEGLDIGKPRGLLPHHATGKWQRANAWILKGETMHNLEDLKRWYANGVALSTEQLESLIASIPALEAENANLEAQLRKNELTEELLREQIGMAQDLLHAIGSAMQYTKAKDIKNAINEALAMSSFEY